MAVSVAATQRANLEGVPFFERGATADTITARLLHRFSAETQLVLHTGQEALHRAGSPDKGCIRAAVLAPALDAQEAPAWLGRGL